MIVDVRLAPLKQIKPRAFALRFLFGGLCTAIAGLVAQHFGPGIGGLFLAFPAIFPSGASLIEKHEAARKHQAGMKGKVRGRTLAGVDAAGAAVGCVGLMAFAAIVWKALPGHRSGSVIIAATACWFVVSLALWLLRKSRLFRSGMREHSAPR